jgi:hypothetical protein
MIVANMNLHEVYDTLMGEMKKLDWKREALLSKAIKEMNRRMSFQNYVMYDYKVPSSNNQYIIYFYREHPFGPILSGYLCVLFDGTCFFTTFMPLSDMSRSQQEAIFEECMKDIDNLES